MSQEMEKSQSDVKNDGQDTNEQTSLVPNIVVEIKNHDSQLFNTCYTTVKKWLDKGEILDSTNMIPFTVRIISLVQDISKQKGAYKKTLVIDLIKKLVAEIDYPEGISKHNVLAFVDATLPEFIDVTISVALGEIDLGKKIKRVKKFCSQFF